MTELKIISTWKELSELPDSGTHSIQVEDDCCGSLINKETGKNESYLSTHTFYESTYKSSTKRLQAAGFNVQLKSWG